VAPLSLIFPCRFCRGWPGRLHRAACIVYLLRTRGEGAEDPVLEIAGAGEIDRSSPGMRLPLRWDAACMHGLRDVMVGDGRCGGVHALRGDTVHITFHDASQTRHCCLAHKTRTGKLDPVRYLSAVSLRSPPRLAFLALRRSKSAGARAPSSRLCQPYREFVLALYIYRPGGEGEEISVAHAYGVKQHR